MVSRPCSVSKAGKSVCAQHTHGYPSQSMSLISQRASKRIASERSGSRPNAKPKRHASCKRRLTFSSKTSKCGTALLKMLTNVNAKRLRNCRERSTLLSTKSTGTWKRYRRSFVRSVSFSKQLGPGVMNYLMLWKKRTVISLVGLRLPKSKSTRRRCLAWSSMGCQVGRRKRLRPSRQERSMRLLRKGLMPTQPPGMRSTSTHCSSSTNMRRQPSFRPVCAMGHLQMPQRQGLFTMTTSSDKFKTPSVSRAMSGLQRMALTLYLTPWTP
mmetsp:Transcript_7948/g.20391  ORF Transcript_7948/g.20391 Transcript_7948/m.20391 type:complete len:269 (+) Transcript_7948:1373-2179(+)